MRAALCAIAIAVLSGPAGAATHAVTIERMKFQPGELSVQRGDKLTWTNKDLVPHTVTAQGVFDSGEIAPGKSWSWVAKAPGAIGYACTYHPAMKARLVVR